ncbi:2'-5' RNA ligase family protein [Ammoniphilus sp. YIM 78166]|uniref:2'-5' RNA ligase family protein n=1 Tax=Ammoniphilus sp. YIM 78166 TaxID=1644106 RepID=UPI001430C83F|nr:2'-5' RNA ligase family protein [Ammoniphilus sp. YIM 78166]
MKYTVAIFPGHEVQERANSYRKRYDSHYALIQPHLKLKWPFEASDENLPAIIEQIEQIAKDTEPFELLFHKIKTFYPTNPVLFFGVQDPSSLQTLHSKLNEGPLKREEKYVFVPHLTIAQDMIEDEFHDVYGRLKMINLNLKSKIDRISLLYQLGDKTWTTHQTFLLGQK